MRRRRPMRRRFLAAVRLLGLGRVGLALSPAGAVARWPVVIPESIASDHRPLFVELALDQK